MRSNDDGNLQGHLKAQSILKGNLDRLTSSNPALPIMLGLVVLSLTPTNGFEQRYARQVDGFGHVGKAVDMALADGLDDNAVVGLRQPASDLATQPWLYQVKAKLMLVSYSHIVKVPELTPVVHGCPSCHLVCAHVDLGTHK